MGLHHFHLQEVFSTQDEAFRRIDAGAEPPFLVTADRQTKGRGRLSRVWHSEEGRSLTMTLMVSLPASKLSGLSLVVGLSLCEAIQMSNLKVKWPNDLMLDDSKVGGILIESRSLGDKADIAIGVGLNLKSLQAASYHALNVDVSAMQVSEAILKNCLTFEAQGFAAFRALYESKMWKKSEDVELVVQGITQRVRLLGVNESGFLRTETHGTLMVSMDGEILFDA